MISLWGAICLSTTAAPGIRLEDLIFFVVQHWIPHRQGWVVWEENGRYPDVIVELMSPTTAEIDTGAKKELYEQVLERDYCFLTL